MKSAISCLLGVLLVVTVTRGEATARQEPSAVSATSAQPSALPVWAAVREEPPSPPAGVLEPALARALAQAAPDDALRIIVVMREQAQTQRLIDPAAPRAEARARLVAALQAQADVAQASVRAYLDLARASGSVVSYTPFWIFNGVAVEARPAIVRSLAARPDVAAVHLDHFRQWLPADDPGFEIADPDLRSVSPDAESVEWGVERVRAPEVWSSLHISGTGVVVASMDTGVDWLHPALQASYRGYNPHGVHNHVGNWFDAVGGAAYPIDDHGHGTHTLGTAIGRGGIGVAPGAQWIGVKVLSGSGYGYDSWIHAGFQWLLAHPPDVVNCSWANNNGYLTTFDADLRALRAAGILAVFANGNNGPGEGTVASPASLPEAFAVGATDRYDEVAGFSGRGPSPWEEIRPHVAAPGVSVRSSLPGDRYGTSYGTSTATPHVVGVAALLRSVSPTLSITRTASLITGTAVPLGDPVPNNDTGWGRVDAFAATVLLAHPGFISGTVARAGDGAPVAGASVAAVARVGTGGGSATTGDDGAYSLALAPALYDLDASAFGYQTVAISRVLVLTGETTLQDITLTPYPTGTLRVRVADLDSGQPVTAAVVVRETPLEATGSAVTFTLPGGTYVLEARRVGYRVVTATAAVTVGQVTTATLALPRGPSILLIDSGPWYYESQIAYYRQALDDLAYAYDEWSIRHVPGDVPTSDDLAPYDIVVWSAPWDGPGVIGAEPAVKGYLSGGGRLLLSGQDVGFVDGGGLGYYSYYRDYLKARLVRDNANRWSLEGVPGDIFAGVAITIAGPGGADNQVYPDEIDVADPDSATPILAYREDGWGGIRIGTCLDYRTVYLSFGFEAIDDRAARREVMERGLAWLDAAPPTVGLELTPHAQTGIGLPGSVVTHALRLRHVGQGGTTDVVTLALQGQDWATSFQTPTLALAPCTSATVLLSVTVPVTAGWDARDVVTLTATSSLSPTLVETAVLTTKAPAPVLLVDDDRFYEQVEGYRAAASAAGLPFDTRQTCPATGWCFPDERLLTMLHWYPIVVWWTGYDWYQPVTADEEDALTAYLEGGGRLLLSSQDFLYYHHPTSLSLDLLGVLSYTEDAQPTQARGVPEDPVTDGMGPWELDYPYGYQNWSDALEPTPGTAVSFRDQNRMGLALSRREGGHATVFLPFPFETLPEAVRPEVMRSAAGWLSWLGGSTFTADRGAAVPGDAVTYTLGLRNDGPLTVTASASNTLPVSLELVPGSLVGPAGYDPLERLVSWEGPLPPGQVVTFTYAASLTTGLPAGTVIVNPVDLGIEDQGIHFRRAATLRVSAPDLSPSLLTCLPNPARPGSVVTGTLMLVNAGPVDAPTAAATHPVPAGASLITTSLAWEGGGVGTVVSGTIHWTGTLSAQGRVSLTYQLTLPSALAPQSLYGVAFLEDGAGGVWERATWCLVEPGRSYLPVVTRGD